MTTKTTKIIFWVVTTILFLFEGVLTALTFQTPAAIQGVTHLGYPVYFATMLVAIKVLGALTLIMPQAPARLKEWAYAGFGFDFIAAFISMWVVDGIGIGLVMPVIFFVLLVLSYRSYHQLQAVTSRQ